MKCLLQLVLCFSLTSAFAHGGELDSIPAKKNDAQNEGARTDASGELSLRFKPYVGFGLGNLTFIGDIYNNNHGQHLTVSRIASNLRFSHPITDYLDFQFHTIFGKISANERSITNLTRNLNFESRIRTGGLGLSYNFDHILKKKRSERAIEPWIYAGIESFEFLSKTDLYDANGNLYHYWDDGSIRNMAQTDPNANEAIYIQRDYIYETDLREQNIDGFGQYQERSWAFPVGIGFNLNITDHFRLRVGSTIHFTTTDLVDNITGDSEGDRIGNKGNDEFIHTSFTLSYSLKPVGNKEEELEDLKDPWEVDIFAKDTFDTDNDGVVDFQDICAYTPKDCQPVEVNGCAPDDDFDGVPNCKDKEENSPGPFVDKDGVTITDEMLTLAFKRYKDSTGEFSEIETTEKISVEVTNPLFAKNNGVIDNDGAKDKQYFIILDSKPQNVKANELYKYLQWKRFKTKHVGDSIYYVLDGLDLAEAALLDDELNNKGVNTVSIGKNKYTPDGKLIIEKPTQIEIEAALANGGTVPQITHSDEITYRIQIAAYNKPQNYKKFLGLPDIVEFQGNDKVYRYYSGIFTDLGDASKHKIIMTSEAGYKDAFVVAFKDGKRISLKEITEVNPDYNENIEEYEKSVGGNTEQNYFFTVQVGAYQSDVPTDMLELYRNLGEKFDFVKDEDSGTTRYLVGQYKTEEEARKGAERFTNMGVEDAFILVRKDDELIELKDAQDLINGNE